MDELFERTGDLFASRSFNNALISVRIGAKLPLEIIISFTIDIEASWAGVHVFGGRLPGRFSTRVTANTRNLAIFREGALGQIDQEINKKIQPFLVNKLRQERNRKTGGRIDINQVESSGIPIEIGDIEIKNVKAEVVRS